MGLQKILDQTNNAFFLIAGPCVVEGKSLLDEVAGTLKNLCDDRGISLIFKSSYRKANRSRVDSFTGIGDIEALEMLNAVSSEFNLPCITDIHTEEDAALAAKYVQVLQIPAFLCRQTSLLVAAGETGLPINIKKGQFMSPEAMAYAVDKVKSTGNENIWLTERGSMFGYQDLVVDLRAIPIMQKIGVPVIYDATHSLQRPNQLTGVTGGRPEFIEKMACAAIAVGADGLFIETHPNPSKAKSDGANMLPLDEMERLLDRLIKVSEAVNS